MTYTHHLDVNDYHSGETYGSVYTKHNDKKVGHLAWSQYGNKVNIHHIQTDPEHKSKGVARGMVDRLKKEWPHNKINWGMTTPEGEAFKRAYYKKKDKKMTVKESEHLMYRASTKHLRTYLNFMKMRTAQGLTTPADEEMVKKAQKHYSTRLLHNVLTSKNIKEGVNEDAPTNAAGGGAVAGIGIASPTIKNPPQAEPGVREKKRILKRFAGYFKKA